MSRRGTNPAFAPTFDIDPKEKKAVRQCEWSGCEEEGEHRANRSPRQMNDYVWFCQEHAREHNKSWNFFEGLTEDEAEHEIRRDTVWQRPTWKLGSGPTAHKARFKPGGPDIKDPFGVFDENIGPSNGEAMGDPANARVNNARPPHNSPLARAYATLDLSPPLTKDSVRASYKKMVKRHHPDANNGDKQSEEIFKDISEAYQLIMKALEA